MDSYQTCAEKEKSTHANTIWNQLLQLPKGKEKEKGKDAQHRNSTTVGSDGKENKVVFWYLQDVRCA